MKSESITFHLQLRISISLLNLRPKSQLEERRKIKSNHLRNSMEDARLLPLSTRARDTLLTGVQTLSVDSLLARVTASFGFTHQLMKTALLLSRKPKWVFRAIRQVSKISSGVHPKSMCLLPVQLIRPSSFGISEPPSRSAKLHGRLMTVTLMLSAGTLTQSSCWLLETTRVNLRYGTSEWSTLLEAKRCKRLNLSLVSDGTLRQSLV